VGPIRTPSRPLTVTSSGEYAGGGASSGPFSASQNPASRELRLLKTQLTLAVGQREEDPERAWLEAVSVREKLGAVEQTALDDPLLLADVERFRDKLGDQIGALTRDLGDEVLAPLYSWMDLLRQRMQLEHDVETARTRVAEARAARGVAPAPLLLAESDAGGALEVAEAELAWWTSEGPPPPPPNAIVTWTQSGGDALRSVLSADPRVVAARGHAARGLVTRVGTRALGDVRYAGSKLELVLGPALAAAALLSVLFARATLWANHLVDVVAEGAVAFFVAALAASIASRRRGTAERRAGVAWVWHYTLFGEQTAALELEVGWLRALVAAMRARRAFDAHRGEGGQLAELTRWRPDLEPYVAEVAKLSVAGRGH
jgi:hypothetical protein